MKWSVSRVDFENSVTGGVNKYLHAYPGQEIWPNLMKLRDSDFETIEYESAGRMKSYKYPKCKYLDAFKKFEGEYQDVLAKAEKVKKQFGQEAFELFAAKSTSTGNWPVAVDPSVVDMTIKSATTYAIMPRISHNYKTYNFDNISAKTAGDWIAESGTVSTIASDTVGAGSVTVRFAYATGGVTNPAITLNKGYDLLASDIGVRTQALLEIIDKTWLQSKASAATAGDTGWLFYDTNYAQRGLLGEAFLCSGNVTTHAGSIEIALSNINGATGLFASVMADNASIRPGDAALVTDPRTYGQLKTLLTAYQRFAPTMDLPWGGQTIHIDEVPVFYDCNFLQNSAKRSIIFVPLNACKSVVAQDITMLDIADTTDAQTFAMKFYGALAIQADVWTAARIKLP